MEERETEGGKLVEVSRNYYAISKTNNSVFYFGEDVDSYDSRGKVGHEGKAEAQAFDQFVERLKSASNPAQYRSVATQILDSVDKLEQVYAR